MAVSTSHCSQPNTIEYEMAMEWLLVQQKSVRSFNALHKVSDCEWLLLIAFIVILIFVFSWYSEASWWIERTDEETEY